MRHLKSGKKLGRTSSHRKALYSSLATALFEHKKIHTTEAKAKAIRPFAEKLITKAKTALARESQGLLPEGQSIDIHNRREVAKFIKNKAVLQELFDTIAPTVGDRPGGYTRIVKTGYRLGDSGAKALIELVDWSGPQEGPVSKSKKKKSAPKPKPVQTVGKVEEETLPPSSEVDDNADVETKPEAIAETNVKESTEAGSEPVSSEESIPVKESASTDEDVTATEEVEHVEEANKGDEQDIEKREATPESQKAPKDSESEDQKKKPESDASEDEDKKS